MSAIFRLLIIIVAALAWTGSAQASSPAKAPGKGSAYLDLAPIGLPVIVDGRIKNYVFIQARLVPAPGADLIKLREKEPYYRDALVRSAHRTPFTKAGDWTVLDEARLESVLLAEARRIGGARSFSAAELVRQTPRRRTGMPQRASR